MAVLDNDTQVSVFVDGLNHPEGIAWGLDGCVYAGGEGGEIYRIDLEGGQLNEIAATEGVMLGLALDANHNVYACNWDQHRVLRITPEGAVNTYSAGAPGEPFRVPNYAVFDSAGNLYVSDSGDQNLNNGYVYKIPPGGGEGIVWHRSLSGFCNGLCLSPEGDYLYVVLSFGKPRVVRVEIRPDGGAGSVETVVELPRTVPDGLALDTVGNLYISCYRPDRVYRMAPQGELEVLAEDFTGTLISAPTNIAFCGSERNILLSTSLGQHHITRYELEATGAALNYPVISS